MMEIVDQLALTCILDIPSIVCRIVIHLSLRYIIFNLLHILSTTGPMNEYKTFHSIKLRFFWSSIYSHINS